jgi:hypothetical protein
MCPSSSSSPPAYFPPSFFSLEKCTLITIVIIPLLLRMFLFCFLILSIYLLSTVRVCRTLPTVDCCVLYVECQDSQLGIYNMKFHIFLLCQNSLKFYCERIFTQLNLEILFFFFYNISHISLTKTNFIFYFCLQIYS